MRYKKRVINSYENGAVTLMEVVKLGLTTVVIDIDILIREAKGRKILEIALPPGSVKTRSEFRDCIKNNI